MSQNNGEAVGHVEEYLGALKLGDHDYLYFRRPKGRPENQVVVYDGVHLGRYRALYEDLPKEAQEKFLEYAGKKSALELEWSSATTRHPARPLWAES